MKLEGFAFTEAGWVQSYGSRYVRPPIIYGDVSRTGPITVKEFKYAQSLTQKPVKGMLTGTPAPFIFLALNHPCLGDISPVDHLEACTSLVNVIIRVDHAACRQH